MLLLVIVTQAVSYALKNTRIISWFYFSACFYFSAQLCFILFCFFCRVCFLHFSVKRIRGQVLFSFYSLCVCWVDTLYLYIFDLPMLSASYIPVDTIRDSVLFDNRRSCRTHKYRIVWCQTHTKKNQSKNTFISTHTHTPWLPRTSITNPRIKKKSVENGVRRKLLVLYALVNWS